MSLVDEARRQFDICNACRYCEGYCAVYPALERRVLLSDSDLTQLANLCHDCRACYYACMYAPPHEFALNPPQILSAIRRQSYSDLVPLRKVAPRWRAPLVVLVTAAVMLAVISATRGLHSLVSSHPRPASPYGVVPYAALLALGLSSAAASLLLLGLAARRYFAFLGRRPEGSSALRAFLQAGHDAATLKNLQGGGIDCTYPTATSSALRRYAHHLLVFGFVASLAATVAASISQDFLSREPPYRLVSAPVLLGLVGGLAMVTGVLVLGALKWRADPAPADEGALPGDWALLSALGLLAASGLATLWLRDTELYGVVFGVHLLAVLSCFLLAPFTKFVHLVYRYCALVRDAEERELEERRLGAH